VVPDGGGYRKAPGEGGDHTRDLHPILFGVSRRGHGGALTAALYVPLWDAAPLSFKGDLISRSTC